MKLSDIKTYEVELTANCNAECPICARTRRKMPLSGNNTLSLSDIKQIFPSEKYISGKKFDLCGVLGDPILAEECIEICEYLSDNGADVISLSTNGGYRTADWWIKLASVPNVEVTFAVDGFSETNHIYRVNVSWKLIERNMRAYCNAGGKGTWRYVVFEHNEHEVLSAQDMASELGMNFVFRTGGRNEFSVGQVHQPRKSAEVTINTSRKYAHKGDVSQIKHIEESINKNDNEKIKQSISTISCRHLKDGYVYVGSNKTLWQCCYLYGKYTRKDVAALAPEDNDWNNLELHTIDEIMRHPNFADIRDMWNPDHEKYISHCLMTCGANGVFLDQNHKINKKSS